MSVLGLPLALPLVAASGIYLLSGKTKKQHSSPNSETRRRRRRKEERKTKKFLGLDFGKKRTYKSARYIKRSERMLDTHKGEEDVKLYVYYKFPSSYDYRSWDYNSLPHGWKYVEGGKAKNSDYKQAIFKGRRKYRKEIEQYLLNLFDKLERREVIKKYKLRREPL
jgi:hypothetical protein